jgi:hypothetical protein
MYVTHVKLKNWRTNASLLSDQMRQENQIFLMLYGSYETFRNPEAGCKRQFMKEAAFLKSVVSRLEQIHLLKLKYI